MNGIAVLAFSGGLDTTFCAVWLREQGYSVHAVAVDTGGFGPEDLAVMEARASAAAAASFSLLDAREQLFHETLRPLLFANALRGEVYPLCVSAERLVQARCVADYGRGVGAAALVHGSTGAGNDQVRFDVAFRVLAPGVEVLAPIRALALSREAERMYLSERGVHIPPRTGVYSINRGLWGATIGGGGDAPERRGASGIRIRDDGARARPSGGSGGCGHRIRARRTGGAGRSGRQRRNGQQH